MREAVKPKVLPKSRLIITSALLPQAARGGASGDRCRGRGPSRPRLEPPPEEEEAVPPGGSVAPRRPRVAVRAREAGGVQEAFEGMTSVAVAEERPQVAGHPLLSGIAKPIFLR